MRDSACRKRITKRVVDAVEPPARGDAWVWDLEIHGFALRVSASGRRVYVVKYATGKRGRARWVTIGEHGAPWRPDPTTGSPRSLTAELARQEALRLRGMAAAGEDPAHARDTARAMPTVEEFSRRYLEEHARPHKAAGSVVDDEGNLRRAILPALGRRRLDQLGAADVGAFHRSRSATPANANRCLALLSHMTTMARRWGVLQPGHPNPCAGVPRYQEVRRRRYLSPEELGRVGAALDRAMTAALAPRERKLRQRPGTPPAPAVTPRDDPYALLALRLLLMTGARAGEILGLPWEQVDLRAGVARQKRKGHGQAEQAIYLPGPAVEALESLPQLGPWVIPGHRKGTHMTVSGLEGVWERLRVEAGVEDVRLHDLRHSFASVAVAGGKSLPMIGALLGHQRTETTARYAHLADDPLRVAAASVAGEIDRAMRKRRK